MNIKDNTTSTIDNLVNLAIICLFLCSYAMIGIGMAIPHTFLAGGDASDISFNAMLLPFASVVIFILYKAFGTGLRDIPSCFLGYCLLPIFTNGISIILKWIGFTAIGGFVFEYRYYSLIAVPVLIVCGAIAYSFFKYVQYKKSNGVTSPNNPIASA